MITPSTLTHIAQLADNYPTEFELTVLTEELNEFGNAELIIEIEATHAATTQYRINKPVGKRWKEADPQIGVRYKAEIEYYAPANRYFISIISEELIISSAETPISTLEYITPYIELPYEGATRIACHIWNLNVPFPSMLIREVGSNTTYRVPVPAALISRKYEIHNRYITIEVHKRNLKGIIKLCSINEPLPEFRISSFERYKPNIYIQPKPTIPVTVEPIQAPIVEPILEPQSSIEIGAKWSHVNTFNEVIIRGVTPSEFGEVVWASSEHTDAILTCMSITNFMTAYELVVPTAPTKFVWDNHYIHEDGVLCRNIDTNELKLLTKHSNLEQFTPLTKTEAMNLVYDDDEIPF